MTTLEMLLIKEYRRQCHDAAKARRADWRRIRKMLKLAFGETNYLKLKCREIPDPTSETHMTRYGVLGVDLFGRLIFVTAAYPEDGEDTVHFSICEPGGSAPHKLQWKFKVSSGIFEPEKITRGSQQKNFNWFLRCVASELHDEIYAELEKALQSAGDRIIRYPNGREYNHTKMVDFLSDLCKKEDGIIQELMLPQEEMTNETN